MKIAILYGGTAPEGPASVLNAKAIHQALQTLGHRPVLVPYNHEMVSALAQGNFELAFIATQGKNHGDGCCQSICEWLGMPYTGTRAPKAALVNDKAVSKRLCAWHGIPTPAFFELAAKAYRQKGPGEMADTIAATTGYPVVAKPCSQGGSHGIVLLQNAEDVRLLEQTFQYDEDALLEQYIEGDFVTVGILEIEGRPTALPALTALPGKPGLQLFHHSFTPQLASLPKPLLLEVERLALQAFEAMGCRGYARVDFMLTTNLEPQFLEINAIPGLRAESFYPVAARLAGFTLADVCAHILAREAAL